MFTFISVHMLAPGQINLITKTLPVQFSVAGSSVADGSSESFASFAAGLHTIEFVQRVFSESALGDETSTCRQR